MTFYSFRIAVCVLELTLAVFVPILRGQSAEQPNSTASLLKIGIVENTDDFDGAGCTLQNPSDYKKHNDHNVFMSDYESRAIMNIDGKDVRLVLVPNDQRQANAASSWIVGQDEGNGKVRRGLRSIHKYRAGDFEVRVDYVVTGVCAPKDESCEVTAFDAKITVTRGPNKRTVNVKGICGV